jgi:hypothetical protein
LETASPPINADALRKRIREETPYWAEHFAKIIDKKGQKVPLVAKPGQLEFDRELEAQRAEGKPMRALNLKARQVGMSTWTQAKAVHRCTLRERYDALTVAHDRETGAKLYRMAETFYANLPSDPELKPALGQHRRQRFLHFAGDGLWTAGDAFPDSRYYVDTAGEFQAGRGGTYRFVHGSEVAFWPQIMLKLTALMAAVPDDPESLIVLESTANGFNEFKDIWDDAEEGRSDYIAFFWPWWREEEYAHPFLNDFERERFTVGDPENPYAEEEPALLAHVKEKGFALTLEQLNWRRYVIANKCGGDMRIFHQEFPSSPEEAFISTGKKVFDPYRVAQLLVTVDVTDPRAPTEAKPGPLVGDLEPTDFRTQISSRAGAIMQIPEAARWTPRLPGIANPTAPWKVWLERKDHGMPAAPEGEYIVFCDPSGGQMEETDEPDYHAIEVIDHATGDQVAEYRSRIDPDLLAREVLLAALFFNNAQIGVERTGGWGLPILRYLYLDAHYPHVYRSKKIGASTESTEQRLGFSTDVRTKPILVAGMQELIRIEKSGIRSRVLAGEVRTYTQTDSGKMQAEPGKYDDCLMAYMGAQHLARELPLKGRFESPGQASGFAVGTAGVSSYDPRYG